MVQEYNRNHDDKEPTKLQLTRDDESRLAAMSKDEAGGKTSGKPREDYKTFVGIETARGADAACTIRYSMRRPEATNRPGDAGQDDRRVCRPARDTELHDAAATLRRTRR